MILLIVMLLGLGFLIALPATWIVLRLSRRAGAFDSAPIEGQVKAAHRRIPNTGGIAIAIGVLMPMIMAAIGISILDAGSLPSFLTRSASTCPGSIDASIGLDAHRVRAGAACVGADR
ncbi:MAG: hypothetical protein R3B67_04890 [Phycisphaerales bacterium]